MTKRTLVLLAAIIVCGAVVAHPHFSKTVTAELSGNELKLNFTTYPYSAEHLAEVADGFVFHCGRAVLDVKGAFSSGTAAIPAGSYLVRARARSVDDWTLFLVPAAAAGAGSNVDLSKGIELDTTTLTGLPTVHHLDLDLYSGHGETDGKLILAVAFGERKLEGTLAF
jgi:hypothetical protein